MRHRFFHRQRASRRASAFTIVEALIAIVILMIFAVTSTMSLNFFDDRAARNRNAEAARAIVEDYVNYLLADSTYTTVDLTATVAGADLDGDGVGDGVACTNIGDPNAGHRTVPASIPLIVTRAATPTSVVTGTLYWRVQPVGTTYGCAANTDVMQVTFLLQYTYRNQTFYYKATTYKANS